MSYTLHQLKVFACVAKHESMTKAAQELYMSQPAVSIQVKKLQEHFGLNLFEVIGKQLYLTEAGKHLYTIQQNINREIADLEMVFSEFKGAFSGKLTIAVVSTAKYFMPYILGAFRKKYQKIDISLKVTDRAEVIEYLTQNKCDLAVFSELPEKVDLEVHEFLENPLRIAAPPNHHLAKLKNIPFKELKNEEFLNREEGSGTRLVLERLFKRHRMKPNIVMELSTNEAVKQAIMAGIGISLISDYSYKIEEKAGLISVLDIAGLPYVNKWKLVYPKGKRLSPVARNFLEFNLQSDIKKLL